MNKLAVCFRRTMRFALVALPIALAGCVSAGDLFAPPSGGGPAVILLSGAGGPQAYRWYAMDVAKLGYIAVLVDGKEICAASSSSCRKSDKESADNLRKLIQSTQADRRVRPGKVAVVGFSVGGGGALVHATSAPDLVAGVVAYYPSISRIPDIRAVASRVATPTLVFAGERDRYFKCCLIESMREFASASREAKNPAELVVYPEADHAFNLDGPRYRADYTADAWEKTKSFLARVHPIK